MRGGAARAGDRGALASARARAARAASGRGLTVRRRGALHSRRITEFRARSSARSKTPRGRQRVRSSSEAARVILLQLDLAEGGSAGPLNDARRGARRRLPATLQRDAAAAPPSGRAPAAASVSRERTSAKPFDGREHVDASCWSARGHRRAGDGRLERAARCALAVAGASAWSAPREQLPAGSRRRGT